MIEQQTAQDFQQALNAKRQAEQRLATAHVPSMLPDLVERYLWARDELEIRIEAVAQGSRDDRRS